MSLHILKQRCLFPPCNRCDLFLLQGRRFIAGCTVDNLPRLIVFISVILLEESSECRTDPYLLFHFSFHALVVALLGKRACNAEIVESRVELLVGNAALDSELTLAIEKKQSDGPVDAFAIAELSLGSHAEYVVLLIHFE